MKEITEEILDKYLDVTSRALAKVKILMPDKTHLKNMADDFLDMAQRYFEDAKHFKEKGDYVRAYGCLNYSHGWLDAGARAGFFDVDHDSTLFTVE